MNFDPADMVSAKKRLPQTGLNGDPLETGRREVSSVREYYY
ncbi:MAG: hypothetical protein ABIV42_04990 [Nitrosospira sp.]